MATLAVIIAVAIAGCSAGAGTAARGAAVTSSSGAEEGTPPSAVAPNFHLELFGNENHANGETISLSQYAGQPVVVNFWYPSCPPCRVEMPDLEASFLGNKEAGVEFIGVQLLGLDTAEDGQAFIDEFGITYAVGPDPDGSIVSAHKVIGFPTTVFLDRDHEVVRSWTGALNQEKLDEIIRGLLE